MAYFSNESKLKKYLGWSPYNEEDLPLKQCNLNGYFLHCPNNVNAVLGQEFKNYKNLEVKNIKQPAIYDRVTNCWYKI